MATQKIPEIQNGTAFKTLLFWIMSLFLAVVIIIVAVTSLLVMSYVGTEITEQVLIIFAVVIVINAGIIATAIRGFVRMHPLITGILSTVRPISVERPLRTDYQSSVSKQAEMDAEFLSEIELQIIELLHEHGDRMLQNEITSSFRVSKATISRAITSLEEKELVVKNRKGVTNEIILIGRVR
ncbi:MAG: MarR family transcriptional regulator [Thermoplasmataceae archaeon]